MDPPIEVHEGAHIHKTLGLYIDDRLLPFMGYLGPNEVCYKYAQSASDFIQYLLTIIP